MRIDKISKELYDCRTLSTPDKIDFYLSKFSQFFRPFFIQSTGIETPYIEAVSLANVINRGFRYMEIGFTGANNRLEVIFFGVDDRNRYGIPEGSIAAVGLIAMKKMDGQAAIADPIMQTAPWEQTTKVA